MNAGSINAVCATHRLWSLWDMLQSYFPIYELALELEDQRSRARLLTGEAYSGHVEEFRLIVGKIQKIGAEFGLDHSSDLARRVETRPLPSTNKEIFFALTHLNDSISNELEKEAVFRIPPERKKYYEQAELFGPKVAAAFQSCEWDIRNAGSCYALGQPDACVHHLMLTLERGLNALAGKVGVPYECANWQPIISAIATKLKSAPRGQEKDFYLEVNSQFGFLKDAYRNHSEHARDDHYDVEQALSILNHVRRFMQAIAGRLTE
jgi:hypothetical protein